MLQGILYNFCVALVSVSLTVHKKLVLFIIFTVHALQSNGAVIIWRRVRMDIISASYSEQADVTTKPRGSWCMLASITWPLYSAKTETDAFLAIILKRVRTDICTASYSG